MGDTCCTSFDKFTEILPTYGKCNSMKTVSTVGTIIMLDSRFRQRNIIFN